MQRYPAEFNNKGAFDKGKLWHLLQRQQASIR
jgi:hypothetical protein